MLDFFFFSLISIIIAFIIGIALHIFSTPTPTPPSPPTRRPKRFEDALAELEPEQKINISIKNKTDPLQDPFSCMEPEAVMARLDIEFSAKKYLENALNSIEMKFNQDLENLDMDTFKEIYLLQISKYEKAIKALQNISIEQMTETDVRIFCEIHDIENIEFSHGIITPIGDFITPESGTKTRFLHSEKEDYLHIQEDIDTLKTISQEEDEIVIEKCEEEENKYYINNYITILDSYLLQINDQEYYFYYDKKIVFKIVGNQLYGF